MQRALPKILQAFPRARTGSFAVARGAATPGAAGRLPASAATRTGAATTWAFGLSCFQVSQGEPGRQAAEYGIERSSSTEGGGTEPGVECCISMERRSVRAGIRNN